MSDFWVSVSEEEETQELKIRLLLRRRRTTTTTTTAATTTTTTTATKKRSTTTLFTFLYRPLPSLASLSETMHFRKLTGSKKWKKNSISVTYHDDKDGSTKTVRVPLGTNLLEAAHANGVDLEGACECSLACSTCHDPRRGFTDGKARAEGLGVVGRNTQSLWNVAYNRWFFWDGRADSLWAQVLHPLEDPNEMGTTRTRPPRNPPATATTGNSPYCRPRSPGGCRCWASVAAPRCSTSRWAAPCISTCPT